MSADQRAANRAKFPEFAALADQGYVIEWAKHQDGTELGRIKPLPEGQVLIRAECVEFMAAWNSKASKPFNNRSR